MTAYSKKSFYRRIIDRQADMEAERRLWDSARKEIIEHYRPDITLYGTEASSAEVGAFLHGDTITEGTGAWALDVMSRGFLSGMVGASLKWLRHKMRPRSLKGNDPVNAWLQRLDDYLLEDVYGPSNFYELSGPLVKDGLSIGSPVFWMVENIGKRRIDCMLPHYDQNYLMRDWFGNDIVYHRKFELSNLQAFQIFGKESLPPEMQQALESGNHKTKHTFLMVVCQAGDPILHDFEDETPNPPAGANIMYRPMITRPWCQYFFVYDNTHREYQGALYAGPPGFQYQPFCAWHYWRNNHETYARTPAWMGIFDEKGGQSAWATMHDSAQMAAQPPMKGLRSMKARTHISPGRFTWASDENEYDRAPAPIITGIHYPHAIDFVDRMDDKRKRHFNVDLFRMLDEYQRAHKQPPTAFQIAQMIAEKNAQIGPAIVSFDRGLLGPVDRRILEIEVRSGRIFRQTDPPMELIGASLDDMDVDFTGPLAQAQKIAVTMRRVQDPLTLVAPIFEMQPDARNKIKWDILVEKVLEDLDFYQDAIASEEEYNAIMDAITRQRQAQAALEQAAVTADMIPKLQGKVEAGSPMGKMLGAA